MKLIVILSYKLEILSKGIKSLLSSALSKTVLNVISAFILFLYYILSLFLAVEALSSSHGSGSKLTITALAYYSTSSRRKAGGMRVETTKTSNYFSLTIVSSGVTRGLKNILL